MSVLAQALAVLLPPLYLAAAFLYGTRFAAPRDARFTRTRQMILLLAMLAHLAYFVVQGRRYGSFPTWDAWTTLSMVTLTVVYLFVLTARRVDHRGVGAIILSMVFVLQLGASSFGPLDPPPLSGRSGSFYLFHALTSAAAAGALVLSGLYGGLYLVTFRHMRARRIGTFVRGMPSLRTLAGLTRRAAMAGFLLMAVGLNFGIGWAHYKQIDAFHYTDPYVVAILLLWVHFGLVAFSQRIPGLSARRASLAAAAGLTVLIAAGLLTLIPSVSFHWRGG